MENMIKIGGFRVEPQEVKKYHPYADTCDGHWVHYEFKDGMITETKFDTKEELQAELDRLDSIFLIYDKVGSLKVEEKQQTTFTAKDVAKAHEALCKEKEEIQFKENGVDFRLTEDQLTEIKKDIGQGGFVSGDRNPDKLISAKEIIEHGEPVCDDKKRTELSRLIEKHNLEEIRISHQLTFYRIEQKEYPNRLITIYNEKQASSVFQAVEDIKSRLVPTIANRDDWKTAKKIKEEYLFEPFGECKTHTETKPKPTEESQLAKKRNKLRKIATKNGFQLIISDEKEKVAENVIRIHEEKGFFVLRIEVKDLNYVRYFDTELEAVKWVLSFFKKGVRCANGQGSSSIIRLNSKHIQGDILKFKNLQDE